MKQEIISLKKIKENELMSKKHKKVCATLIYIENFLILASTITGYISISDFASLFGIFKEITSSAIGLKTCAIAAGVKKYKSLVKKKKKKRDKILLLAKPKLNNIKVLNSEALIDSTINDDEFVLINNVLKEIKNVNVKLRVSLSKILVHL